MKKKIAKLALVIALLVLAFLGGHKIGFDAGVESQLEQGCFEEMTFWDGDKQLELKLE